MYDTVQFCIINLSIIYIRFDLFISSMIYYIVMYNHTPWSPATPCPVHTNISWYLCNFYNCCIILQKNFVLFSSLTFPCAMQFFPIPFPRTPKSSTHSQYNFCLQLYNVQLRNYILIFKLNFRLFNKEVQQNMPTLSHFIQIKQKHISADYVFIIDF